MKNALDFYGNTQRKRGRRNRRTGVFARIAERFVHPQLQRNEQRLNELAPPDGSVTVRRHGIPGLAREITPEEVAVLVTWIDERLSALGVSV